MSDNLKIDHDLLLRAVAKELRDEPVQTFYNGERSTNDIDLAVSSIMRGSFISLYHDKLPNFKELLKK